MKNGTTAKLETLADITFLRRLFSDVKEVRDRAQRERRLSAQLLEWAQADLKELLSSLDTTEQGLSTETAERRLQEFGPNEVSHEKTARWYVMLVKNFYNPFIALLCALAVASYFLRDTEAVVVLVVMVMVSVLMRFFQEYRSSKAADQLKSLVQTTATVTRSDSAAPEPGDTTQMGIAPARSAWRPQGNSSARPRAGRHHSPVSGRHGSRRCPPDLCKRFVYQPIGFDRESLPVEKYDTLQRVVEKHVRIPSSVSPSLLDLPNVAFMGTNVVSGTGTALVLTTGSATYFGWMARSLAGYRAKTSFDLGVNSVSWLLRVNLSYPETSS